MIERCEIFVEVMKKAFLFKKSMKGKINKKKFVYKTWKVIFKST